MLLAIVQNILLRVWHWGCMGGLLKNVDNWVNIVSQNNNAVQ